MKYILIIGDGMADNPLRELAGKTPLEEAKKPVIDSLAARGLLGSVKTVPDGFAPGSDTAIMSIFGCAPQLYFSGRAPLEAAAQGIKLAPGDAAYRCNNVSLSDGESFEDRLILSHSAGGIDGEDSKTLITYLFGHPDFRPFAGKARLEIKPSASYRHLCVQKSADITGISLIPPHDHLDERVGDNLPTGCVNAQILKELMQKSVPILDAHPINRARREAGLLPANAIWFWAEGTAAGLPNFSGRYGKSGAVISAVPLCHGIARLIGLDVIGVEGATGEVETNYEGKVRAALEVLKTRDFVTVHLEGPDECTHNGDLGGKLQAVEWLDSRVAAPLLEALDESGEDYRILVLSDHKTLLESRLHDGEPVPFIIYDSRKDSGAGLSYTEKNGEAGVFVEDGTELMPMLFELK